jgi:uncharacterized glyoxalase superfamily protein PhnB
MAINPIPEGFSTLTPYLVVDGADKAIDFYKRAFGAELIDRAAGPDGKVMNAQLKFGNSMLMLNDEFPDWGAVGPKKMGGTSITLHMYVPDVDAVFKSAVDAGCEVKMPLENQFWGDRYGVVVDPFGYKWGLATRVSQPTQADIEKAMASS